MRLLGYEVVRYPPADWVRNRQVMMALLPQLGINCVLDVGANRGQFGQSLREAGYTGRIVSFEPVSASFEALRTVAARDANWAVYPFALGSRNGTFEINVTEESVFCSFLEPLPESRRQFPENRTLRTEQVSVRRLDEVYRECVSDLHSPRTYLKMDTQGFDLEVFRGAEGILASILAMQSEISFQPLYDGMPGYAANLAEYRAKGFEVYDFLVVNRDLDRLAVVEMDCVLVRTGARA